MLGITPADGLIETPVVRVIRRDTVAEFEVESNVLVEGVVGHRSCFS
jgi:hypothetical protein